MIISFRCYPINTVLIDPLKFRDIMNIKRNYSPSSSESDSSDSDSGDDSDSSDSSSGDSSDSSSSSSSSSSEVEDTPISRPNVMETPSAQFNKSVCRVCNNVQNKNMENKPECFIKCASCRRRGILV